MASCRIGSVRGGVVALVLASLVGLGLAVPAPSAIGAGAEAGRDAPIGIGSASLPAPPPIDPGVSSVETYQSDAVLVPDVEVPEPVATSSRVSGSLTAVEGLPVSLRVLTPSEVLALDALVAKAPPTVAESADLVPDPAAEFVSEGVPPSGPEPDGGYVFDESDAWIAGVAPNAKEAEAVAPVDVEVASFGGDALRALGGDALGFTIRAREALEGPVWVEVEVDYSGFRALHGADWVSRLKLVRWDCPSLLAAAGSKACGDGTPVDRVYNNPESGRLRAAVELSSGRVVGASGRGFSVSMLTGDGSNLGLTSEVGSFAATSLSTTGSWQVPGNSGEFTYQVPIVTPPALSGGPAPSVSLNYSSGGADAMVGNVNSQASEVGVGWSLGAGQGFIERQYRACTEVGGGTGDTCWYVQNGFISLNGRSDELIPINGTTNSPNSHTQFRLKDDPDWLVERIPAPSGDFWVGEHWKVTTPDGFTYWFGRNDEGQNSQLTRPLRGITSGYPCYARTSHLCDDMPYRWMLDKVTDPFGNDMIYKYELWSNYAKTIGDAYNSKRYDAGALLTEIDYGRAPNAGITTFRAKVEFRYVLRCTQALSSNLETAPTACPVVSNANGASYPDVPTDLYCQTEPCTKYPSFFQLKRLAGIKTSVLVGTSWDPVAQWRLVGSMPDTGDSTNSKLFLDAVQRVDAVTSPIGTAGTALLPANRFTGTAYQNRKDGSVSGGVSFQPIFRVSRITDELGKQTDIAYQAPTTTFVSWRVDDSNSYPQWITWGSSSGWAVFRKWVVDYVKVRDLVTGPSGQTGNSTSKAEVWNYEYLPLTDPNGGAAKHYTPDFWFEANNRSYNVWRGYYEITVIHGCGVGPFAAGTPCSGEPGGQAQTVTKTHFYRGMHADYDSSTGGTSTVQLTRSWATSSEPLGASVYDYDYLAGTVFETFQMDGTGASYVSASRHYATFYTEANGIEVKSTLVRVYRKWRETLSYERLRDGTAGSPTWRDRRVDSSFDALGRATARNNTGFLDVNGDERCDQTGYIAASAPPSPGNFGWMNVVAFSNTYPSLGTQPTHTTWAAGSCSGVASSSEAKTFYNANSHVAGGIVATAGAQSLTGFKPTPTASLNRVTSAAAGNTTIGLWQVNQSTYDTAGRVTSVTDPRGNTTTFGFNSTYGYPNTATYPISGLSTSTVLDPATGQPLSKTDQNGNVTSFCYDNLGRLRHAYLPGQTVNCAGDGAGAAARFTYDIGTYTNDTTSRDWKTPTIVATSVLQSTGVRIESAAYLDGYGRTRETQTASPTSGKIVVSGVTIVDDRANTVTAVESFAITDSAAGDRTSASGGLRGFAAWPNMPTTAGTLRTVESVYDTANRATSTTRKYGTTSLVTSSTAYYGTKTVVTPQIGSMTATTVDAFGRTIKSELYNGTTAPSGTSITNGSATTNTAYTWNATTGQDTTGYLTTTVTDDAGNQTITVADLGGRVVSNNDPNAGLTVAAFDLAGNITKIDDANATDPVWTSYDALNRPILRYANTTGTTPTTAEKLAEWVYDGPTGTPAAGFKGLLVKEISWQASQAFVSEVTSYTSLNQPATTRWIIPGTFGTDPLAGEWRYQYSYDEAGHQVTVSSPPGPVDTGAVNPTFDVVTTHYNAFGAADTLIGADLSDQYVAATGFDDLGRVTQRTLSRTNNGTTEAAMVRSYLYDATTGALSNIRAGWDTTPTDITTTTWFQNDQYTRDAVGNVTKVEDLGFEVSGSASGTKECFVYDQWNRLVRAHTATTATTCLTNTSASPVANQGLDPYDTVWAFDDINRINTRTDKLTAAATTYNYAGTKHAVTSTSGGAVVTYGYNPAGSMTTRGGVALTYDSQGRLAGYGTGPGSQSYQYATTNQRVTRTAGATTTLYLPGMEATTTGGGTPVLTRYRSIGATLIGVETDALVFWNCGNEQNSTTCQAAAASGTSPAIPPRRHYQPYGNSRGATVFATTDHGFLGQPEDTTGLTYLNNRYYDSGLGSFTTVDPLVARTGMPYLYGDGNPTTRVDPSGMGTCSAEYYVVGSPTGVCDNEIAAPLVGPGPLLPGQQRLDPTPYRMPPSSLPATEFVGPAPAPETVWIQRAGLWLIQSEGAYSAEIKNIGTPADDFIVIVRFAGGGTAGYNITREFGTHPSQAVATFASTVFGPISDTQVALFFHGVDVRDHEDWRDLMVHGPTEMTNDGYNLNIDASALSESNLQGFSISQITMSDVSLPVFVEIWENVGSSGVGWDGAKGVSGNWLPSGRTVAAR